MIAHTARSHFFMTVGVVLAGLLPLGLAVVLLSLAGTIMPTFAVLALLGAVVASGAVTWYALRYGQQSSFLLALLGGLTIGGIFALFAVAYPWMVTLLWLPALLSVVLFPLLLRGRPLLAVATLATLLAFFCAQWAWLEVRTMQANYEEWEAAERERLQAVQRAEQLSQRRAQELGSDDSTVGGGAVYAEQTEEDILDVAGMGAVEGEAVDEIIREGRRARAAEGNPFAYRQEGASDEDANQAAAQMEQISVADLQWVRFATHIIHIMSEIMLVFVISIAAAAYLHALTRLRPVVPVLPIGRRWLDQVQPGPTVVAAVGESAPDRTHYVQEVLRGVRGRHEPFLYCGDQSAVVAESAADRRLPWPRPLPLRQDQDQDFLADSQVCFQALWFARASYAIADYDLADHLLSDLVELFAGNHHTRAQASRRLNIIWDFPEAHLSPLFIRRMAHLLAVTHGRLVILSNHEPDPEWRDCCDSIEYVSGQG